MKKTIGEAEKFNQEALEKSKVELVASYLEEVENQEAKIGKLKRQIGKVASCTTRPEFMDAKRNFIH